MKQVILCFFLVFSVACIPPWAEPVDGNDGTSCSVEQLEDGALISCDDGTEAFVPVGEDGLDGVDGTDCLVRPVGDGAIVECGSNSGVKISNGQDGRNGQDGTDGTDGLNGQDGTDGLNGQDGTSCTVVSSDGGVLVSCEDGSSSFVADGQDGTNGLNGEDGTSCTTSIVDGGAEISCDDGSSSFVADGEDGADGLNGQDGLNANDEYLAFASDLAVLSNSIVSILIVNNADDSVAGSCSGSKLSDGTVATAAHCLMADTYYALYKNDVPVGQTSAWAWNTIQDRDSVLLTNVQWNANGQAMPGLNLPVDDYQPVVGEVLGLVSHPLGLTYSQITIGHTTDELALTFEDYLFWQGGYFVDIVSAGGSSGGPVFNRNGALVGLLVGGFVPESGLDLSIILPFR